MPALSLGTFGVICSIMSPPGRPWNSLHPSMILPRQISVVSEPTECCLDEKRHCLRAPYINYNRCLPGSWSDEMFLRLAHSRKEDRVLVSDQICALINAAVYKRDLLDDLASESDFWKILGLLN